MGFKKGNQYGKLNKGKKKSEEHKRAVLKVLLPIMNSYEFRKKMSESLTGNKNPNWKGGISKQYKNLKEQIRRTFKYRQWHSDVFTRDNFTCQKCSIRGIYLEVHHIKKFIEIIKENNIKTFYDALNCEELWNINNGITLCKNCHLKER